MAVGVAFALVVLALIGSAEAGSYLAGFLMEKALSLDNVFVIAVLLGTFAVPQALKADVLTFGIAVALMLRTVFIFAGVTLLELFHPVLYVMGALLVFTGFRLIRSNDTGEDFADGRAMRTLRRVLPVGKEFKGRAVFEKEDGHRVATPLLAALLAVALADVIFAIDSIPAVLSITTDTFLIFAANAFALLGLRALYFLLDGMAQRFEYLHYGLGALLIFVGVEDADRGRRRSPARGRLARRHRHHAGRLRRRLAAVVAEPSSHGGLSRALAARGPASPARRRRSRSAAASSGLGSHCVMSGSVLGGIEAEELEEQRRGAVEHGAELRAARLLDQPAVGQRGGGGFARHAADAGHLGTGHGLQVGDDRERLGLGGRERGRARTGEQTPRGLLGVRVAGERKPAAEPFEHQAAVGERRPRAVSAALVTASSEVCSASASSSSVTGSGARKSSASRRADRVSGASCGDHPTLDPGGVHRDLAERLVLLPRRLAALVELQQREDRDAHGDAIGVLDRLLERERARRA